MLPSPHLPPQDTGATYKYTIRGAPHLFFHTLRPFPPQDTGATYEYTIGGGGETSPTYSFVANPAKGAKARMSFAVYGDMGETKYRASKNPM